MTPEMEKGKDQKVTRERGERIDDILTDREKQWEKKRKKCVVINWAYYYIFSKEDLFHMCSFLSDLVSGV